MLRAVLYFQHYNEALKSLLIPRDADGNFAKCFQYDVDANALTDRLENQYGKFNASIIDEFVAQNGWPTVQCVDGWDYDTSEFDETLVTKVSFKDFSFECRLRKTPRDEHNTKNSSSPNYQTRILRLLRNFDSSNC